MNINDVKSHIKVYISIFVALMVLTVLTVSVSYLKLSIGYAVTIAMIVAVVKGSLVASYFMHLISEKKAIYWTLILTSVVFVGLMLLPILSTLDQTSR